MKIYKISCYSRCGTYFGSYLKSLTILAEDEKSAIRVARNWMRKNQSFLYKKKSWNIEVLCEDVLKEGVVDYDIDSDY